jgi:hypothetical protein
MLRSSSNVARAGNGSLAAAAYGGLGLVHSEFAIDVGGGLDGGDGGMSSRSTSHPPAEAPLDDLLQHVNHLISEFDRMYAD